MQDAWNNSLLGLFFLGAFHGINPGMGWLFAVALGMQEKKRSAVWRAMIPLGLGHALAVAAAILIAVLLGAAISIETLRWPVSGVLIAFGVYRLFRHNHPRWVGMQVSSKELTAWSFLMSSAHGAGLMVVPLFINLSQASTQPTCHTVLNSAGEPGIALLATGVHGLGYLFVTAFAAVLVFEKLGLGLLRKAWFNLDFFWAVALVLAGIWAIVA